VTDNAKRPRKAWRERAACRDVEDPDAFFPTAEAGPERDAQVTAAKAICARCEVRADCLVEALARIPYGIAGGLTEHERRRLRTRGADSGQEPGGLSAQAREVLSDGPDRGMSGRKRARIGRELLVAGRTPSQVASACRVSQRAAERWATSTANGSTDDRAHQRAGGGEHGGNRLPSGSPQHTTPRAGTRAPEGHRG
jgi:hypothetical protein